MLSTKLTSVDHFQLSKTGVMMPKRLTISDTDKSKNIQIEVGSKLTLDEMEKVLAEVGNELDLAISHLTTLSLKKYPKNRHWHFKRGGNFFEHT